MNKILFITPLFNPRIGGIQKTVFELTSRLNYYYKIDVLTRYEEDRVCKYYPHINIYNYDKFGKDRLDYYNLIILFDKNYQGYELTRGYEHKTIFVPVGITDFIIDKKADLDTLKKRVKEFKALVFNSSRGNDFKELSTVAKKYFIISNGANDPFTEEKTGERNLHLKLNLLHVGTATGSKGHHEAFRLFSEQLMPFSNLWLVTNKFEDNPRVFDNLVEKVRVFNCCRKSRLLKQNISIFNVGRKEVYKLFKQADLLVYPSNIEIDPLVIYEAMASKTPFLASPVGTIPEIVENYGCGELFKYYSFDNRGLIKIDIDKSYHQLSSLCINLFKRKMYSKRGYENFKKYHTWYRISEKYRNMISTLIST